MGEEVFKDIYESSLQLSEYGMPLWNPEPSSADPVSIGDVGYIYRGQFIKLINISKELKDSRPSPNTGKEFPMDSTCGGDLRGVPKVITSEHIQLLPGPQMGQSATHTFEFGVKAGVTRGAILILLPPPKFSPPSSRSSTLTTSKDTPTPTTPEHPPTSATPEDLSTSATSEGLPTSATHEDTPTTATPRDSLTLATHEDAPTPVTPGNTPTPATPGNTPTPATHGNLPTPAAPEGTPAPTQPKGQSVPTVFEQEKVILAKSESVWQSYMSRNLNKWPEPTGHSRNDLILVHGRIMASRWAMVVFDKVSVTKESQGYNVNVVIEVGDNSASEEISATVVGGDCGVGPYCRMGYDALSALPEHAPSHCVFLRAFKPTKNRGLWGWTIGDAVPEKSGPSGSEMV